LSQIKEISIIVFAYNNIDYTINTINSLLKSLKNNTKYNFTYNIYDDFSSDSTENYFKNNLKEINYIRQNKNRGFNYLCNLACHNNINSDFIVLLNNDLKFSNSWLNTLLDEMIKNNAMVAGPITNSPGHQRRQDIRKFVNNYIVNDNDDNINDLSKSLSNKKPFTAKYLNGFCMVFNMKWLQSLSKPIFEYQDLNFGLEDNFFKKNPCNPLIVPSSFVFHYKQVTVQRTNWAKHHFRLFDNKKKYKIAVGVITDKRLDLLKKCINSLSKQSLVQSFDIFILDNDISKSAKEIININLPQNINLFYHFKDKKDSSFALNKIVKSLKTNYDYLAFIKDNAIASEDWLYNLLSASIKFNADVISGPIKAIIDTDLPFWLKEKDFLKADQLDNKTGEIISIYNAENIIIRCEILNKFNFTINKKLKDMSDFNSFFFKNLSSNGYKIKWCNEAKVYNHINNEKINIKWILYKEFKLGNSQLFILKLNKNYTKIIYTFLISIIQIVLISMLFILGISLYFCGYKRFFFKKIKIFMKCLGIVTSLLGYKHQDYK